MTEVPTAKPAEVPTVKWFASPLNRDAWITEHSKNNSTAVAKNSDENMLISLQILRLLKPWKSSALNAV